MRSCETAAAVDEQAPAGAGGERIGFPAVSSSWTAARSSAEWNVFVRGRPAGTRRAAPGAGARQSTLTDVFDWRMVAAGQAASRVGVTGRMAPPGEASAHGEQVLQRSAAAVTGIPVVAWSSGCAVGYPERKGRDDRWDDEKARLDGCAAGRAVPGLRGNGLTMGGRVGRSSLPLSALSEVSIPCGGQLVRSWCEPTRN